MKKYKLLVASAYSRYNALEGDESLMDNQPTVETDMNTQSNAVRQSQNRILLPLIALGLDFLPIFMGYLMSFGIRIPAVNLLMILSPISGLILGIVALSKGKAHIGTIGKIVALFAVALPLAIIGLVIFIVVGAATGLISFM